MLDQKVFETRLRDALARHVANAPTDFDAHEFARAVAEAEPRRHGRTIALRRPRIVVPRLAWLVIATALLIVALAATVLVSGARPVLVSGPASWQPVVLGGHLAARRLTDIAQTRNGYLGVGTTCLSCYGQAIGLVWTSHDSLAWEPVETGDTFVGAELRAVVAGDQGFVAVGNTWADGANLATAWWSAEGLTWSPVTLVGAEPGSLIADVIFANGRYVAVGLELSTPGASINPSITPRIWWSDNGEHWVPAAGLAAGPSFLGVLTGVAAGGPGFVAVSIDQGIWISPDGDTWSQVHESVGHPYLSMTDVAGGRDHRLVVTARVGRVGASGDGVAWTWVDLPGLAAGDSYLGEEALVATDWGFVVVSTPDRVGTEGGLWTSRDGHTWIPRQSVPDLPLKADVTVIRGGDAILVSGWSGALALPGGAVSEAAIP